MPVTPTSIILDAAHLAPSNSTHGDCFSWGWRNLYRPYPQMRPSAAPCLDLHRASTSFWNKHDDIMTWKCFPHYWLFMRGIDWSPVDSLAHKEPGPCRATVTWCCRKNFSQWEHSFLWKLCCHWLKGLWQRQIAVVRQDPVKLSFNVFFVERLN